MALEPTKRRLSPILYEQLSNDFTAQSYEIDLKS